MHSNTKDTHKKNGEKQIHKRITVWNMSNFYLKHTNKNKNTTSKGTNKETHNIRTTDQNNVKHKTCVKHISTYY